jgi:hypothetical protein
VNLSVPQHELAAGGKLPVNDCLTDPAIDR